MDGCGRCVQCSFFVVNVVILLGGLALSAWGIWRVADGAEVDSLLDTHLFFGAACIQIATGLVVVFLAALGFCGVFKRGKCMLVAYSVLLFLLFVVLLVAEILGYVFLDRVEDAVDTALKKALVDYDDGAQAPVGLAWDQAQREFECCGIEKAEDWLANPNLHGRYPASCCRIEQEMLPCRSNASNTWREGCREKLEIHLRRHGTVLSGIGISVAFLALVGIAFGCALCTTVEWKHASLQRIWVAPKTHADL